MKEKGIFFLFVTVCRLPDRLSCERGDMPSTARASIGGICYHVLNRGKSRQGRIDNDPADALESTQQKWNVPFSPAKP